MMTGETLALNVNYTEPFFFLYPKINLNLGAKTSEKALRKYGGRIFNMSYGTDPALRMANKIFLDCMETTCNYLLNSK